MKRTSKSIIISYYKRGLPSRQCFLETDINISTIKDVYSKYWNDLKENPVKTERKEGKTILTIQSKINFEKIIL
jgi:hypothetical protein